MRNFNVRKPTGVASFPLILLAGVEGAGKTWAAVEATRKEDIDQAFFIEVGESQADAYGAIPGADYGIVDHDGTLGEIRGAIQWASQQPAAEGKYNLLIIDSISELWQLITDNAQAEADARARRKGRKRPDGENQITMDLWNRAKEAWHGVLSQCRKFPGPVILTARLENIVAMNERGEPTQDRTWKIKGEKSLPFNVQVVVQAREPRRWVMTKIATTVEALQLPPGGEMAFNDFSVEKLLDVMGVAAGAPQSTHVQPHADGSLGDEAEEQDRRRKYVREHADLLMSVEREGDISRLQKAVAFYSQQGDQELARMASASLERVSKAQAQRAKATVEQELGASEVQPELVTAEIVA